MKAGDDPTIMTRLGAAMALQFSIGGAIIPFISVVMMDRGLSFVQISSIFTVASGALMVFPFLWGMVADRYMPLNRLFTVINSLVLLSVLILAGQTGYWGMLVAFTLFQACYNPTLMLVNPLCFHHLKDPRTQFGLLRSWGSLGWMVPSLPIYLWLVSRSGGEGTGSGELTFVMVVAAVFTLAMIIMTFWLPPVPPGAARGREGQDGGASLDYWTALKELFRNVNFVIILVAFFLMAASFSIFGFYSPAYLVQIGMDRSQIGPVQCLGVLLEVIVLWKGASAFYRRSYSWTIILGCLLMAGRHLVFAYSANFVYLVLSYLMVGLVIVFFHVGASLLVHAIARPEVRSTAQTLLVLCGSGLGPMFSNGMVGYLTRDARDDLGPVFLFAAILAGVAAVLILLRGSRLDEGARESPTASG